MQMLKFHLQNLFKINKCVDKKCLFFRHFFSLIRIEDQIKFGKLCKEGPRAQQEKSIEQTFILLHFDEIFIDVIIINKTTGFAWAGFSACQMKYGRLLADK